MVITINKPIEKAKDTNKLIIYKRIPNICVGFLTKNIEFFLLYNFKSFIFNLSISESIKSVSNTKILIESKS